MYDQRIKKKINKRRHGQRDGEGRYEKLESVTVRYVGEDGVKAAEIG